MKSFFRRLVKDDDWTVQRIGLLFLIGSILLIILGYPIAHPNERFTLSTLVEDLYSNVSSELIGIAVTILIIDRIYRRYDERNEEKRARVDLTRQLGSTVNEVAKRAAEELRAKGWLTDGSLQEIDLRAANLEDARLWKADLQGANMQWARLKKANLNDSILVGANLTQANLQTAWLRGADLRGANLFEAKLYRAVLKGAYLENADLSGAHLEGARLEGANLRNTVFANACWDELTVLPDGEHWSAECDLKRFTDPLHPNFFIVTPQVETANADEGDE
jgi:hypothetical protein